ncbi:MAG: hypothetical protein ACOYXT_04610 [Bacteroidota bacterium]
MTNLNGLTPEQKKLIFDLSKRIEVLESKLIRLQDKLVRIDPMLTADLARSVSYLSLN